MTERKVMTNAQFADAEHLWFWFVSCRTLSTGLMRHGNSDARPCELVDIETLVTRMYLAGRISAQELEVLKKYGEARKVPNQSVWGENRDVRLWRSAIESLGAACRAKGWIE